MEALLRRLLHLASTAPAEKALVFSQFPDALKMTAMALQTNGIRFVELKSGREAVSRAGDRAGWRRGDLSEVLGSARLWCHAFGALWWLEHVNLACSACHSCCGAPHTDLHTPPHRCSPSLLPVQSRKVASFRDDDEVGGCGVVRCGGVVVCSQLHRTAALVMACVDRPLCPPTAQCRCRI